MNAKNAIYNDGIHIDFCSEILYGDDSPSISFMLKDAYILCKLLDNARVSLGYPAMLPESEEIDYNSEGWQSKVDFDGWYDFYYGINSIGDNNVDSQILAVVCNSIAEDNGKAYTIDVQDEDKQEMYRIIENQFQKHDGKSIIEIIKEAERGLK